MTVFIPMTLPILIQMIFDSMFNTTTAAGTDLKSGLGDIAVIKSHSLKLKLKIIKTGL